MSAKMKSQSETPALLYPDHPTPTTRREFLAAGIAQTCGMMMVPNFLQILAGSSVASAANCAGGSASGLLPLIVMDLAGGAGLSGNFLVGKTGGAEDYLASYDTLGIASLPQNTPGSIDRTFGAPMHANASRMLAGMKSVMSGGAGATPGAQEKTSIITVAHVAQDDSGTNPFSPLILASRAGLKGSVFPNGLGNYNTASGTFTRSPITDFSLKPVYLDRYSTIKEILQIGPILQFNLTGVQRTAISNALGKLSQEQGRTIQSVTSGPELANAAECGHLLNSQLATSSVNVDPATDAIMQAVYGYPTQPNAATQLQGALVYNALTGNAGACGFVLSGCDYHDGTQTTGDTKDYEIGQSLGRILETAHRMGKAVVVVGFTDGGVYSDRGTRVWRGDASQKSLSFIATYKPTGKVPVAKSQIGAYTDGQGVDRNVFFAVSSRMIPYIHLANYLHLSGRMDLFSKITSTNDFPIARVNEVIGFG
jgi:hypothetical protein